MARWVNALSDLGETTIWSAASKVVSKWANVGDEKAAERDNIIKKPLGLANTGIPIGREDNPVGYVRWKAAESDTFNH